ncbi:hypothetical protein JANAI62_01950 [Jannaschia pagri]|uniref:Pre-peptidase C-terminal domain-containing protein n=1 Tax=Jannaschia pagri TaxID=2829797 RepID=A0ABQ4NGN8_9RHOB|nr:MULTISPECIES: PPC domain-containing protein [unclassified Jannaschia]GIT90322.1 hypothetical protein JANAI61_07800 [Jannaschia sp. AI_61]GIT93572.1 hypothetical protein JANAI62_01950 [Jannaschia sp. AI_62]
MKYFLTATALATLSAAPALAQAPICGGISLVGEWVGGTPEASDLVTATEAFDADGQVPIAGHLVRMFTLSEDAGIRVEVAARPAGDPYFALYDAEGTEVAADDDSGGNFASKVEMSLAAGTYCLAARSYESGVTDVAVRIGTQAQAPLLTGVPDSADQTETPEGGGGACGSPEVAYLGRALTPDQLDGGVSGTANVDAAPGWAFSLAAPSPVTITADSVTGDPLIRLLDENGTQLAENDDFDGLNSRIDMTAPLPAGDFCVEVEDLNGSTHDITVGLVSFDPVADRKRRLDAAEFAPTSTDDVAITDLGTLQSSVVSDVMATAAAQWLRFEMPEGGLLVAEAIGTNDADPAIVLFDRLGRRLAENDDGPVGLDSFVATRLLPGSYMVAVRLVSEQGQAPVRLLLERYVPAQ